MNRNLTIFVLLGFSLLSLFLLTLFLGSVHIPLGEIVGILIGNEPARSVWEKIVLELRLPAACTAILAGLALSISGLQMQTLFRNPLAGPYVLGISSGASLGVAILILATVTLQTLSGFSSTGISSLAIVIAATLGASSVMLLITFLAMKVKSTLTLLIVGIMFGYAVSGLVGILIYFSKPDDIQAYLLWSFGSFRGTGWRELKILLPCILIGAIYSIARLKSLNAMLLGDDYAISLGQNLKRTRFEILVSTALLAGSVTAFCGPVAFIGIAIPHLCRALFRQSDHSILIPAVILVGSSMALIANIIAGMPGSDYALPLNAVTSIFGAPVIIWVVIRQHRSLDTP